MNKKAEQIFEKLAFQFKKLPSNKILDMVMTQGPMKKVEKAMVRRYGPKAKKDIRNSIHRTTAGGKTIFGTYGGKVKGKKTPVGLNSDRWGDLDKTTRRNVIAHEGFHANAPIVGHSELLAHAYGGWKAPKKGSSVYRRIIGKKKGQYAPAEGAVRNVHHLIKTRPGRAMAETAIATGATAGAVYGGNKLKDKISGESKMNKKAEQIFEKLVVESTLEKTGIARLLKPVAATAKKVSKAVGKAARLTAAAGVIGTASYAAGRTATLNEEKRRRVINGMRG